MLTSTKLKSARKFGDANDFVGNSEKVSFVYSHFSHDGCGSGMVRRSSMVQYCNNSCACIYGDVIRHTIFTVVT